MEDGSYTADDKWDVFVAGPSGARLEVRYGALIYIAEEKRPFFFLLKKIKKFFLGIFAL
jgi:hypothetical protein